MCSIKLMEIYQTRSILQIKIIIDQKIWTIFFLRSQIVTWFNNLGLYILLGYVWMVAILRRNWKWHFGFSRLQCRQVNPGATKFLYIVGNVITSTPPVEYQFLYKIDFIEKESRGCQLYRNDNEE